MSLNKIYFFYNLLTKVLLKTLIIFESTYNPSQLHCVVLVLLNQLQMLKYLILPIQLADNQIFTTTLQFTQYIFRPYLYFWRINEIEIYSTLIFSFTLIFFCLWMNLLLIDFQKDKKNNFIIAMKNFQQRSTLNVLLANIFKFFILIKSHFLGFIILESAFFMYYNVKIEYIFQIFVASLLIFDIIILFMLDEYLLTFSLNYYPTFILKKISNSYLSFFIKLIQISQIIIFSSYNPKNQIIQIFLCLLIGLLQLYNISNYTVIADNTINRIIKFNLCILISSATEQILNFILTDQYECQQLWILLTILLIRIVTIKEKEVKFNWNTHKIDNKVKPFSESYFINQKQFYNFILKTQLSNNNESQINKALFLNQYHQKSRETQHSNSYSKDQHIFQKIDQLHLKQSIIDFNSQLSISKFQNSQFYFNYFQMLFLNQNHLLILNYCMKIVNQITNTSQNKNHQKFLIKNGLSLKYKIFFQYQLQLVQYQLQLGFHKNHFDENDITRKAIQMTQLKFQQQKTINQLLEKSIKIKINTILDIYIKQKEYQEIETIFMNSVKEILYIKQQLEELCSKTCVSSNNCALMFFYLEILNDLISSQQISNMSGQYLGLEERVHDFIKIQEALQYDYSCLKLSMQDENQISLEKVYLNKNIKISISNDLSFYQMIPESISEIHRHYIRCFFQTGKNKYYSQINTSFVLLKQGLIIPIQMCMDLLFDFNLRNLQAVTFIRELQDIQYFIFLDKLQKITEISVDFYEKVLNYPMNKNMILKDWNIKHFVPQLQEIDWNNQYQIKDCQFQFPTYCQISIESSQSQFSLYFTGTLTIEARLIGRKIQYYVIKITDINISRPYQPMPERASYFNFVEEQEKIDHPFDFRSETDQPKHVQYSSRIDTLKPLLSPEIHLQNISEGSDETKNQIQLKKEFQEAHDFGDVGSQQSHVSQVKVSTYYKQFLLIKKLVSSKVFPNHIFKFNIFYTISIVLIIIHIILLMIESQNLKNYLQYISFLSVKYDIFEPILSFLNTRYTILNLQIALQNNIISDNEYHDYITFPTSNLVKGYDDLKISVFYILSKQEFQQFFEDKYFQSTWFEKSSVYMQRNITIRTGILQFLDYQYYFKMAYIQNTLSSETPYFYFSYKNYQNLYKYFSTLSNEMLELIIEQIQFQKYQITLTSVIIQSLLGLTICIYIFNIIKQRKLKNQVFNCYLNQDLNLVNLELNRLKEFLYLISNNQIQTFNFDLKSFDQKLSQLEQTYKKNNCKMQPGFSKKYRQIRVYSALQFMIVLINALLYFVLLFITKSLIEKYLDKIQNTAQFYQQFSNLGVNVLIIYSQREVLYRSPLISFFTSSDLELTRNQIHSSLQEIANIGNLIVEVNQDDYLFDEQSINLFDQINSQSLCLFLPDDIKEPATLICPEVLQGILQKGLVQTINYMHNIILSESQISNFTSRKLQSTPILELEGATFTSQVIKVLVKLLLENLNFQTNQIKSEFLIVFVIFLIINTFVQIFIMLKFSQFEYKEIDILRKGIYLLPQQALLFDDHLQRELNNLIIKGQLA